MKKILCLFFVCLSIFLFACTPSPSPTFGVWWWDDELDVSYINFAEQNDITEIYYCSSKFNAETMQFISLAHQKNIKVFYLDGDYRWLTDNSKMTAKIQAYTNYQNSYPNAKFDGIHFDIEPHQDDNFDNNRAELITKLIEVVYQNSTNRPDIYFAYDIPFWLDDEIEFLGIKKCAYMHIIDHANNVTLMSYRDTAEAIYDVSKDEIEYATLKSKTLNLGVETKSFEGDKVSFMEEGKTYMNTELKKLRKMLPTGFGIVVHHIKTWYDLPDVV